MSPEMLNNEDYDNKTDVYSYGIFLLVLFTGKLPNQSFKDKINHQIKMPKQSEKISQYCIDLIKKCLYLNPSDRPSFDDIINDMKKNSYALAPEVIPDIIDDIYQVLDKFISKNKQTINSYRSRHSSVLQTTFKCH